MPFSTEILKNGNHKKIFHFYVDEEDEYLFYTIEGLTSSNDADVLLEKVSILSEQFNFPNLSRFY